MPNANTIQLKRGKCQNSGTVLNRYCLHGAAKTEGYVFVIVNVNWITWLFNCSTYLYSYNEHCLVNGFWFFRILYSVPLEWGPRTGRRPAGPNGLKRIAGFRYLCRDMGDAMWTEWTGARLMIFSLYTSKGIRHKFNCDPTLMRGPLKAIWAS